MKNPAPASRGSNGAGAGGAAGLHSRGQSNLGERGRGMEVERGMHTPTRSTAGFLWTKGLTWTRCVQESISIKIFYLLE